MAQKTNTNLILASASPRRRELLGELEIQFSILPANIPEVIKEGEDCFDLVIRLATEKAEAVSRNSPGRWVLGADTLVVLPTDPMEFLGKPSSPREAIDMLSKLSGQEHWVLTGVCLHKCEGEHEKPDQTAWYERSQVSFRELSQSEIVEYVQTGEPMDKAGAYAIQGGAKRFVDRYTGSWSNIVGLPLESLRLKLAEIGLVQCG